MSDPYVWMRHPTLPDNDPVQTPRQAFEAVYRHLGWELSDTAAGPSQAALDAAVAGDAVSAQARPGEGVTTERAARGKAGSSKGKES